MRQLLGEMPAVCSCLPQMLRTFQDALSTYVLYQGKANKAWKGGGSCVGRGSGAELGGGLVREVSKIGEWEDDGGGQKGSKKRVSHSNDGKCIRRHGV